MALRNTPLSRPRPVLMALALAAGLLIPAWAADFEVKAPDGRTLLIKDDGTWRVADAPAGSASAPPLYDGPQAELTLVGRQDVPGGCAFTMTLVNQFPYEIRSLVPDFVVQRPSGVAYTTQSLAFTGIKPGDQRSGELRVQGLACKDIATLHLERGDRCEMGDLNRFSDADGRCLARLKVVPSRLLKFEK